MREETLEVCFIMVIANSSQGKRPEGKWLMDEGFEIRHLVVIGKTLVELSGVSSVHNRYGATYQNDTTMNRPNKPFPVFFEAIREYHGPILLEKLDDNSTLVLDG